MIGSFHFKNSFYYCFLLWRKNSYIFTYFQTICERGLKTEKLEQLYLTKRQELLDKQKAKEDEKVAVLAAGDIQSVESSATKSEQPAVQLAAAA